MKKYISFVLAALMLFAASPVYAADGAVSTDSVSIEYLEDGSKSGNKASATATGTHYMGAGHTDPKTKTVTLTCSPTGSFS